MQLHQDQQRELGMEPAPRPMMAEEGEQESPNSQAAIIAGLMIPRSSLAPSP